MRLRTLILSVVGCLACSDSGPRGATYEGTFSNPFVETFTKNGATTCTITFTVSGTVKLVLNSSTGDVTGQGDVDIKETVNTVSDPGTCGPQGFDRHRSVGGAVSGTTVGFQFAGESVVASPVMSRATASFTGTLSSEEVNGTLTITRSDGPYPSGTTTAASAVIGIVLR